MLIGVVSLYHSHVINDKEMKKASVNNYFLKLEVQEDYLDWLVG